MSRVNNIEVAVGTDAIFYFIRLAWLMNKRPIGNRVSFRRSIKLGVRTRAQEDRICSTFTRHAVEDLGRIGKTVCDGSGEGGQCRPARDRVRRALRHS